MAGLEHAAARPCATGSSRSARRATSRPARRRPRRRGRAAARRPCGSAAPRGSPGRPSSSSSGVRMASVIAGVCYAASSSGEQHLRVARRGDVDRAPARAPRRSRRAPAGGRARTGTRAPGAGAVACARCRTPSRSCAASSCASPRGCGARAGAGRRSSRTVEVTQRRRRRDCARTCGADVERHRQRLGPQPAVEPRRPVDARARPCAVAAQAGDARRRREDHDVAVVPRGCAAPAGRRSAASRRGCSTSSAESLAACSALEPGEPARGRRGTGA